jgi:diguanylate cyclase (GGDEF)-like protein
MSASMGWPAPDLRVMSKILVVDDSVASRSAVREVLRHEGHEVIEASDGADALRAATQHHPRLIISDILMPSMDGYEFVRQLRTHAGLAATAVVFYTANYHSREARRLAEKCGVARVIIKPCGARDFLKAITEVLDGVQQLPEPRIGQEFDREHLEVLTNTLAGNANQLAALNSRFAALIDLNVQLASERDPAMLLPRVCAGARKLLGAKYAVLAIVDGEGGTPAQVWSSGIEAGGPDHLRQFRPSGGLTARVLEGAQPLRARATGAPLELGLPADFPPADSALAVPLSSLTRSYGWLCLADKVGSEEFDSDDERMLGTLGAQVGRIYESGMLYQQVQRHAAQLQHLNRVHAMLSGIESLIIRAGDRHELFRQVCRLAVAEGGFAEAWCGWMHPAGGEIVPAGWAGPCAGLEAAVAGRLDDPAVADILPVAAMRSGGPVVCNDIERQARTIPHAAEMQQRGYQALSALPFIIEGKSAGCLMLAARNKSVFDAAEVRLLSGLAADISFALDHIAKSEKIHYLAYYDSLTGLANRTLLHERLTQQIANHRPGGRTVALLLIDPDRFHTINETFGRFQGDELLRQLARSLTACVGEGASVARTGGGQFAALVAVADGAEATRLAEELWQRWLAVPFQIDANEIRVSAKAGIALLSADADTADALLKHAEAALSRAKSTGEQLVLYTPDMSARAAETLGMEAQLRTALEREQFVLHYQPKVDLETRKLVGVEALIRWRNPDLGLVPPLKFIPLLEETGLIVEVGRWALRRAKLDRTLWTAMGLVAPRVAVNVSTVQLQRRDFVRMIEELVGASGKDAGLDIEVTESVIISDAVENIEKLGRIRELGVGIAIDDFGTGYSSLGYLTKLPAQVIKIDRSFTVAMTEDPGALTLVSTIISLAHSLKMATVAEGVESQEQAKLLRLLRCDQMQGYLVSKPVAFDELSAQLGGADE